MNSSNKTVRKSFVFLESHTSALKKPDADSTADAAVPAGDDVSVTVEEASSTAQLVRPHARFRASFLAAMAEFVDEGRRGDGTAIGIDLAEHEHAWTTDAGFAAYVELLLSEERVPRKAEWVCCSNYFWVDGDNFIGRIAIRHTLTEWLHEFGGHVGYDVRPSARRRGHATAMLRAALREAHVLGIDRVLITCDPGNIASRRTIERNGGVLEDQRGDSLRFWVQTEPPTVDVESATR